MDPYGFGDSDNLVLGGVRFTVLDILFNTPGEDKVVLQDNGNLFPVVLQGDFPQIYPVD